MGNSNVAVIFYSWLSAESGLELCYQFIYFLGMVNLFRLRFCSLAQSFNFSSLKVDDNVTRHIAPELANDDWDMMILHYLGLDHIGHLIGPSSSLIPPKLQEMDRAVQLIHSSFERRVG